jgi:ankyrin repeat protein
MAGCAAAVRPGRSRQFCSCHTPPQAQRSAADAADAVAALLGARADPAARTRAGSTPLHLACEAGAAACAAALLTAGASAGVANADGVTPLHAAAAAGSEACLASLLGAGAPPGLQPHVSGLQPFALRLQPPCIRPAASRAEAAAPVCPGQARQSRRGSSSWAGTSSLTSRKARVLESGLWPSGGAKARQPGLSPGRVCRRVRGCSPLSRGQFELARSSRGAVVPQSNMPELPRPNTQESTSKTALYLAAEKGQAAAIGCLLRHGADPHAPALISTPQMASRLSPLWAARRGGHADVEVMLVAAGATELGELVPVEEPRD